MEAKRSYESLEVEFITLSGRMLAANSCEARYTDTGEVAVDDGSGVYCGCTAFEGWDYTRSTGEPVWVGP